MFTFILYMSNRMYDLTINLVSIAETIHRWIKFAYE